MDFQADISVLKTRTKLVLRGREMTCYAADLRGAAARAGKKNILIYVQGRLRAPLFEHLMCSTGHVTGYREVLNTVTRQVLWPTRYVRRMGKRNRGENVIIHVMPEHLDLNRTHLVNTQSFLMALVDDGWFTVHLQRSNIVRMIVPNYLAEARGGNHKLDDIKERATLNIPTTEFISKYERQRGQLQHENALVEGIPYFMINNQDRLERPELHQQTVDTILDKVGLPQRPVSTRLKKINTFMPADLLPNLDGLEAAFASREWTL
ncbi:MULTISPECIES: hypothetical protein [Falsihalocynthiibacter]|uniref:hypothetical protein n=1 Tax=Falsihalocynthiibacter TaxID=2854182 RepID=UPI003001F7FD